MPDITNQLALWIEQLRSIAQTGLAFGPHAYDRERYEALLTLSATMAATLNEGARLDPELARRFADQWRAQVVEGVPGYVTPKVGIGAAVFNSSDEILLIKRLEGAWFYPTGWSDIGYSPAQVAAKEVLEETGLEVTPMRLVGIYDSSQWRPDFNPHFYSIVFYCRLDGGELRAHPVETLGAGFFARDVLPQPVYRSLWLEHAWRAHADPNWTPYFDR